jgi:TonB-dependent receptor
MRKLFISLIISIMFCTLSFSQGTIRGKITDENGEAVIGATIMLKSDPTVGTMSDFNGQFSLKISSSTPQSLLISYISYQTVEETVNPKNGEILVKDFNLVPVSTMLNEVEIVGKATKSRDFFMEKVKAKSTVSLDYISSETIKRTGDVNVSSAVARVAGVSTNGSFITVRGIGDRYMKTAINGCRIPTLDPFTNNIKLDMFPASLVDNIVLVKTASPDLPGDWAGAYLSVETKDYPDQFALNVETSFGYNQQTTNKDVVTSQRSATDWLGYDNGLRDINHNDFVAINTDPSTYDEFVALGLGNYFKSLGVTENNWSQNSTTYTKLGYEQLGLLGKAQFNDATAYATAAALYASSYKSKADALVNAAGIKSQSKLFPNNWFPTTRKAPVNFSQSFSIGDQITLFGKPLGYLAGFRYSSAVQYDANSVSHKYYQLNNDLSLNYDTINQKTSKETNGWSALFNLSYKYHPNHSISLLFMPNLNGVNSVRDGTIHYASGTGSGDNDGARIPYQFYEERKQLVYQLKSEHYLPGPKMKIECIASYTNGSSKAPDFRVIVPGAPSSHRFFRYLKENLFDSHLSAELPIAKLTETSAMKLKFGAAYQYNYRKSDQYDYEYYTASSATSYFSVVDSTLSRVYRMIDYPSNHNFGRSHVKSGFIMLDYPIISALRFSGGIRVEHSDLYTDVSLFDSLGLASNDLRRKSYGDYMYYAGKNNKLSVLPSANLIIKLKRDELAPINLRLNFSQTIARPSIREVSDGLTYDYELKSNVRGNPELKTVQIYNYDMRFEAFFESGDNISVSAFYKDFKNHIEFINYGSGYDQVGVRWLNSPYNCWLKGIEIEGKKTFLKQLELRANITLVNSRSVINTSLKDAEGNVLEEGTDISHTMYGQAPYVINGILSYTSDKMGLSAALSYNVQGPRLVIVGTPAPAYVPDIYEMPRHLFDLKVSKSVGKHYNVSLKALDILNTSTRRAYKFAEGYILDYDKYTWGTNYVLAISYKL